MTPGTKRTIITSKTTGRRYFLVRSANRPNGRRYYVCTNPTCKARVPREADLYCKTHAQEQRIDDKDNGDTSTQSDQIDEDEIEDSGEVIDEENSTKVRRNTKIESNRTEDSKENGNRNTTNGDDIEENHSNIPTDSSIPLSPNAQSNRQVQVDEVTGARTFRDSSGRRRYLCKHESCTNMLKRQSDLYCRLHTPTEENVNNNKKNRRSQKRHSAPPVTNPAKKTRYRSPFQTQVTTATTTAENKTQENQSDGSETPKKQTNPQRTGTTRSFRDASGKLRFLCSISTCHSRVPRQSELYCKRHQLEAQQKETENKKDHEISSVTTNGDDDTEEKTNHIDEKDVQVTNTVQQPTIQSENKKRKLDPTIVLSSIPPNKIVIATTTLLDDQWIDVLSFLRQFPQIQLSTNLNVNNSTTHLIVDDSENQLHCTITKKIVQAAVRHNIFIVSSRWLNESMRLNTFIDEHPYEIISDSHTTLRLSEQTLTETNKYLFNPISLENSYAFAIECRQCQGSINRSELIELIHLTGAYLYPCEQAVNTLIVLCDTNDKNLTKIKEKYIHAPATNIKYVTSDFLLKSIIKFEIQDIEKYSL